jgi:haloacetate dehalogenase
MMIWSTSDDMKLPYGDPLEVWRPWCPQITGHGIDSTHHIAEQAPGELVRSLQEFLSAR